jgi:acyl-CoA thioesterase FadM
MAVALVQAACVDRESFKPAPIPASLAERLAT